MSVFVT